MHAVLSIALHILDTDFIPSSIFFRTDKGGHFVSAQVVVSQYWEIWSLILMTGHNNDPGALTGMDIKLINQDIHLLADAAIPISN